jgi:hypothetical protein
MGDGRERHSHPNGNPSAVITTNFDRKILPNIHVYPTVESVSDFVTQNPIGCLRLFGCCKVRENSYQIHSPE